jgi:hypothetical protein
VDESAHQSARDKTEQPENDQCNGDEIQHTDSLASGFLNVVASGFNIAPCSADGVAAGGKKCQRDSTKKKWK